MGRPWPGNHSGFPLWAVERRIFSPLKWRPFKVEYLVLLELKYGKRNLVIEAVFEDFDIKTAVFNTLGKAVDLKQFLRRTPLHCP